jgi:hypothetical protein
MNPVQPKIVIERMAMITPAKIRKMGEEPLKSVSFSG